MKVVRKKCGEKSHYDPKWIKWFGEYMGWKDNRTALLAKIPRHKFKDLEPMRPWAIPDPYEILHEFVKYYDRWFSLREAEIWVGIKIFGWSVQQIADLLELSPNSVRSTLQERVAHFLIQSPEIAEVWTG